MNDEPTRYLVVCDHPDMNRRYLVAEIDDDRPVGGDVRFQIFRGGYSTLVEPSNKLGSRRSIPFQCGACTPQFDVALAETSLPALVDKIALYNQAVSLPIATQTIEEPTDLGPDGWYDVIVNGADPGPGTIIGNEQRHVISLREVCEINRALRDRARHRR